MHKKYNELAILLICIHLIFLSSSCVNTRNATYFNGIKEAEYNTNTEDFEPIIQKNDLLSISVSSLNPEASKIFNTPNVAATQSSTITGSTSQASGYLVDQDGFILFPVLGNIKAAGLTKTTLKETISNQLINKKLLIDPIVSVRYLNFKVSVLGEVARPSVHIIPNEKISLLEAIGLAGDLTIYAKRDNVLLIREEEGKKKTTRIDLTTDELFKSPYYYLKSNDIVYVEPNKSKVASAGRANQLLPVIFASLSLAIVAITSITR